jgi:hypothetical protein
MKHGQAFAHTPLTAITMIATTTSTVNPTMSHRVLSDMRDPSDDATPDTTPHGA